MTKRIIRTPSIRSLLYANLIFFGALQIMGNNNGKVNILVANNGKIYINGALYIFMFRPLCPTKIQSTFNL
jgi:hypothetical protein